jgi:uncharacterized protein
MVGSIALSMAAGSSDKPARANRSFLISQLALPLALLGSFAHPGSAHAASFDCTQATSPREHLICREPQLSKLDEQLARAYSERREALSPHGAELLRRAELSWLHYVGVICPLSAPPTPDGDLPTDCLLNAYRERLDQLSTVGQKVGLFVFNRIDLYAAHAAPDSTGNKPGFYIAHVVYPQIDNVSSPQVAAWNKRVEKHLALDGDGDTDDADIDTDYQIGYASGQVISVQWTTSDYEHGAAHGTWETNVDNVVLLPNVRSLTASDLFAKDEASGLQKIFWSALLAKGWTPPDHQSEAVKAEIGGEVVEPNKWLITKAGLAVSFSAYEGGCYACNPGTVTAPWTELKPLLSATAIAP